MQNNLNKLLRVIHTKDLEDQLDCLESALIETHYKHGLPITCDREATISLAIIPENKVKYHEFQKISKYKNGVKTTEYNIPMYNKNAPNGFSLFMNQEEKETIENYIKKNGMPKNNVEMEDVNAIPLPRKEHNFCHMCQIRFEDYIIHIKSVSHQMTKKNHSEYFVKIEKTFQRIRDFWEEKNHKKVAEELKTKESIMNQNNNEISTKFDTNLSNLIQNPIIPVSTVSESKNIDENKENMSILNNVRVQQNNLQSKHSQNNILNNVKSQDVLKNNQVGQETLVNRKRKFSEANFKESFESDVTKRSVRLFNRNTLFQKKKEFSKVVDNMQNLKCLMKKSISFNLK